MQLPNRNKAHIPQAKIVRYLLDLTNDNGKSKAEFFLAFGFSPAAWQVMAQALIQHAHEHPVAKVEERPPFGIHYVIEGTLHTPDGRNPRARVVWIIDEGDDVPRLVSAYPLSKGQ
jgi:hypothetical protein